MLCSLRAAAIIAVAIAFIPTAHADNKDKARDLYRDATHHYDFGEYQRALDGFKEAYQNYEDPAFLFNIAQCHRALGHKQEAITFYKSYLRNTPDAPNRDEVQKTVADLQAAIDGEKSAAKPAVATLPSPPSTAVHATATNPPVATTQTDVPKRSRKWIWGVVAGAVVVVGVGVGLGVGLGARHRRPRRPTGV